MADALSGAGEEMQRKLTTIVAMDVVGYSTLMERDDVATLDLLRAARADVIDPAVARHGGRTVKLIGDGTLADFPSVVAPFIVHWIFRVSLPPPARGQAAKASNSVSAFTWAM